MPDDMEIWKNNRVDTGYVRVSIGEDAVTRVEKCGPPTSQSAPTYNLKHLYHIHGTNHTLKKLTACLYSE